MAMVESQLEAPFSVDTVRTFWRLLRSLSLSSEAASASCHLQQVRKSFLALTFSFLVSDEYECDCCKMRATSVIFSDAQMLALLWRQGLTMPKPCTGKAIMSASLSVFWRVREGRKCCLMVFSTGSNACVMQAKCKRKLLRNIVSLYASV